MNISAQVLYLGGIGRWQFKLLTGNYVLFVAILVADFRKPSNQIDNEVPFIGRHSARFLKVVTVKVVYCVPGTI